MLIKVIFTVISLTSLCAFAEDSEKPYNTEMLGNYVIVSSNSEYCGDTATLTEIGQMNDDESQAPFSLELSMAKDGSAVGLDIFRYLDKIGPFVDEDKTYAQKSTLTTVFNGNEVSVTEKGWVMGVRWDTNSKLVYDDETQTLTYTKVEKIYWLKETKNEKCVYKRQ